LGDARTSDNDSPRRAGLSIDRLGDLSIDYGIAPLSRRWTIESSAKMKPS
jgi:hypothetical protein